MNDVLVIGAGIAGLSVAWRISQLGFNVQILEADPSGRRPGAPSPVAGGMLAPSAEVQFEEMGLYHVACESLSRWPSFADELKTETGLDVGYRTEGTLIVAVDRDDAEALSRLFRFQQSQGLNVSWLTPEEALEAEPYLSPRIAGAIHSPDDHQVDVHAVLAALSAAVARHSPFRFGARVVAISPDKNSPSVTLDNGEILRARVLVVATGAWSRDIDGLRAPLPIRPVKGQMVVLRGDKHFRLNQVIRTLRGYLVPRADGRVMVGATAEEMGFDNRITAGAVYRLLENAVEAVPGVEELEIEDTWVGFRPAARDHLPVIGWGLGDGITAAAGLYRHGILLAPLVADELALEIGAYLAGSTETSEWIAPFSPDRF